MSAAQPGAATEPATASVQKSATLQAIEDEYEEADTLASDPLAYEEARIAELMR